MSRFLWDAERRLWMPIGAARGPVVRRRVEAAVAAWQQILNLAQAEGWYGLFDPTNPNTRSLVDGNISVVSDALGNLPDVAQSTAGNRPALVEGAFGQLDAGLYVRANSQRLATSGNFSAALTQPNFIMVVLDNNITSEQTDDSANNRFAVEGQSSNRNAVYIAAALTGDPYALFGGATLSSGVSAINGAPHIIGGLFNSTTSEIWIDGVSQATGNAGVNSLNGLVIGADNNQARAYDGHIGPVLIYNGNPSSTVRNNMFDLLQGLTE